MFAEKSVYQPVSEDEGVRVLVMRQWPRGVRMERVDLWLKALGPTTELLRDYAARRISWPEFAARYEEQITTLPESVEALATLREMERRGGTVTLFCHERQPPCHRFLLLAWLQRTS